MPRARGKGVCGRTSAWARDSGVQQSGVEGRSYMLKKKKTMCGCHVDMFHVTLRRLFFNKSPECIQRPALNNTLTLPKCFPPPPHLNVHYFSLADSPPLPSSSSLSSISTLMPSPSCHAVHPHPRPHIMPSAHALALTPRHPPMPSPSHHAVRPRPCPHAMPSAHAFTSPTPILPTFSSH